MALADYVSNARLVLAASNGLDPVASAVAVTRGNQGSLTDPSVSGTGDTAYYDFGAGNGYSLTPSSGALFNVGTGDCTVVLKARGAENAVSATAFVLHSASGSSGLEFAVVSATFNRPGIQDPSSTSFRTTTSNSLLVNDQDFIVIFRRSSGTWTVWVDADGTGGAASDTPGENALGSRNLDEAANFYFGSDEAGANVWAKRVYFVALFDAALLDADITADHWSQSNLISAFGASPATPVVTDGPNAGAQTDTAYNNVTATVDTDGAAATWTLYGVVQLTATSAPSDSEVISGLGAGDTGAVASDSDTQNDDVEASISFTGLTSDTGYTAYILPVVDGTAVETQTTFSFTTNGTPLSGAVLQQTLFKGARKSLARVFKR